MPFLSDFYVLASSTALPEFCPIWPRLVHPSEFLTIASHFPLLSLQQLLLLQYYYYYDYCYYYSHRYHHYRRLAFIMYVPWWRASRRWAAPRRRGRYRRSQTPRRRREAAVERRRGSADRRHVDQQWPTSMNTAREARLCIANNTSI